MKDTGTHDPITAASLKDGLSFGKPVILKNRKGDTARDACLPGFTQARSLARVQMNKRKHGYFTFLTAFCLFGISVLFPFGQTGITAKNNIALADEILPASPAETEYDIDSDASVQNLQYIYTGSYMISAYAMGLTFSEFPTYLFPYAYTGTSPVSPGVIQISILDQSGSLSGFRIAVWSEYGGQDDLQWYYLQATDGGIWRTAINTANHAASGNLNVHFYGDRWGSPFHIFSGITIMSTSGSSIPMDTVVDPSNPYQQPQKPAVSPEEYRLVFDAAWYADHYPDLKAAFGTDETALLDHFLNNGMKEGRQAAPAFNVHIYKANYSDLRASFGDDLPSYYRHYIQFGADENRNAMTDLRGGSEKEEDPSEDPGPQSSSGDPGHEGSSGASGGVYIHDGIDYSPVFDAGYYLEAYPDLKAAFGSDHNAAFSHFLMFGMKEGRSAKESFSVNIYRGRYEDLQQ
ncbi:MAG: GBS Bsp-like repeat-containing protein, partial [Parasporobacterium sp.]|nr:GBS Bsp-like repeat-containing protein [Parasporobacterium sp.]